MYVLTVPGGAPQTFLTQADAAAAKTRQGGKGSIARTSREPSR